MGMVSITIKQEGHPTGNFWFISDSIIGANQNIIYRLTLKLTVFQFQVSRHFTLKTTRAKYNFYLFLSTASNSSNVSL